MRSKQYHWDEVVRTNKDYCVAGMNTIADARRATGNTTPFRFIYVSGRGISRDMTKKPWILGDYQLMRVRGSVLFSSSCQNLLTVVGRC
jgi:hypothetical protein